MPYTHGDMLQLIVVAKSTSGQAGIVTDGNVIGDIVSVLLLEIGSVIPNGLIEVHFRFMDPV